MIDMKFLEKDESTVTENRSGLWPVGSGEESDTSGVRGHGRSFWGDGNILYFDCVGGYTLDTFGRIIELYT